MRASSLDLDEAQLPPLLVAFYTRVRADPLIGPIFNEAVHDWPSHLDRLRDFRSAVMLTTERYKGNPVAMHLRHAERIAPAMFARRLELQGKVTRRLGTIRVLEGRLRYVAESDGRETILDPDTPGLVRPAELHPVEPLGAMRMRVNSYHQQPALD